MQNVKYVYIRCHICYIFIFYDYDGGKIIIKQRIPNTNEMIELWRMAFYKSDLIIKITKVNCLMMSLTV